jgi:phosphatidylglycerol lysyltransferase
LNLARKQASVAAMEPAPSPPATSQPVHPPPVPSRPGARPAWLRALATAWRWSERTTGFILTQWRRPAVTALVSLIVFGVALQLIRTELYAYQLADLERALEDLGWGSVALAIGGMLASYGALALNDRAGLELIGKRLPVSRTLRASLAAAALARSLGYSWATAGAARQRLYRRWGLTPNEIGTLSFLTGTLALVAALACAGLGLVAGGAEIAAHGPLGPVSWTLAGLMALVPAGVLLLVLRAGAGRAFDLGGTAVALPQRGRMARHLAVLLLDRAGAAFVLFALLPDHGGWSFPAFLAVFVLAGLLGSLSGAPGGLGVFEAAILTLSPLSQDTPGAAVALLVYRLIYNVIPLVVATAILGADHAAPATRPAARAVRRLGAAGFVLAPRLLAVLVFCAGLVLLGSVATPSLTRRILVLEGLDLRALSGISHVLAGATGVALLLVAASLWQRARRGRIEALVLLTLGACLALGKGLDWEEAAGLLLVAAGLAGPGSAFNRTGADSGPAIALSPGWLAAVAGAVLATAALASFAHAGTAPRTTLDWRLLTDFTTGNDAARSARAVIAALGVLAAAGTVLALRALRTRTALRADPASTGQSPAAGAIPADVLAILAGPGAVRPDARLVLLGDKQVMVSAGGDAFAMWRPRADRWVMCGPPVGAPAAFAGLIARLHRAAEDAGAAPVWYAIPEPVTRLLEAAGCQSRLMGRSRLADIAAIGSQEAAGPLLALDQLSRLGFTGRVIPAGQSLAPGLLAQLEAVSQGWLSARGARERAFSLGRFDPAYLAGCPVAVIEDQRGRTVGFANLWTTPSGLDLALDLVRTRADAPDETVGALVGLIVRWARPLGWRRLDLGLSPEPLAPDAGSPFGTPVGGALIARLAATLQDEGGEAAHGLSDPEASGMAAATVWEPLYLCAPPDVLLPTALMDVAILTADTLRNLRRPGA